MKLPCIACLVVMTYINELNWSIWWGTHTISSWFGSLMLVEPSEQEIPLGSRYRLNPKPLSHRIPDQEYSNNNSKAPVVVAEIGGSPEHALWQFLGGMVDVWKLERYHNVDASLALSVQRNSIKERIAMEKFRQCVSVFGGLEDRYEQLSSQMNRQKADAPHSLDEFVETWEQQNEKHQHRPNIFKRGHRRSTRRSSEESSASEPLVPGTLYYRANHYFTAEQDDPTMTSIAGEFRAEIRRIVQLDPRCCTERPLPHETVIQWDDDLLKLGPESLVEILLPTSGKPNLRSSHKQTALELVIVTVQKSAEKPAHDMISYAKALQDHGITARVVPFTKVSQALCFLAQSQQGLVGVRSSSPLVPLASIWSNTSNVKWLDVVSLTRSGYRNFYHPSKQQLAME